ncbi:MAG: O-antigen ligase family protein [Thermodesulfobacteriota bacterium]|nr:O-antigen ligase family protein [Thermodesulfobacteriota bacterium]
MIKLLGFGFLLYACFWFLSPVYQLILSLALTANAFDLAPKVIFGRTIWDFGIVLLFTTGLKSVIVNRNFFKSRFFHENILILLFIQGLIVLLWSIAVYQYPLILTLKASRWLLLGLPSYFIFVNVLNNYGIDKVCKYLYLIFFVLLFLVLIQYFFKIDLLMGLRREYRESLRYVPIFILISSVFAWSNLYNMMTDNKVSVHGIVYVVFYFTATLLTFTRGNYIAHFLVFLFFLFITFKNRKIKFIKTLAFTSIGCFFLAILLFAGKLDYIIDRSFSAIEIISGHQAAHEDDQDTYTGRIALLDNRFNAVLQKNPAFGYGFIHEAVALKKGYKEILSFDPIKGRYLHLADNGWATIVLNTGVLGALIYLALFISVFISFFRHRALAGQLPLRLGFFLAFTLYVITSFINTAFIHDIQLPLWLLAGYTYTTLNKQYS